MTTLNVASRQGFASLLLPAILGGIIGACVAFDPPLSYLLAGVVDISVFGKNILLQYPYQLLSTLLIVVACLVSGASWFRVRGLGNRPHILEKTCIVFLLISSQTFSLTSLGKVDGYDIATAFVFFVFFISVLPGTRTVVLTKIDLLNLLLVVAYIVGFATSLLHPLLLIRTLLVAKLIMLSILLVNFLRTEELVRFFIATMITVTTVSAVIAIGQEILYAVTGTAYIGMVDEKGLKFMFEPTPLGELLRVPAFVMSYKSLVFLLVVNLALVFNLLLHTVLAKSHRYLLYVAAVLMLLALALTFSKDGWVGLCVVIALSVFMRWKVTIIYGPILLIALGVLVYVLGYWDDMVSWISTELSWGEQRLRVQLNRQGLIGFLEEPALFAQGTATLYTSNHLGWPAHNNWILAANEMGLYGFTIYVLLIAYTLYNLAQLPVYAPGSWLRGLSKGVTIAFISLLVVFQTHAGFLDTTLWIVIVLAQVLVLIGKSKTAANSALAT